MEINTKKTYSIDGLTEEDLKVLKSVLSHWFNHEGRDITSKGFNFCESLEADIHEIIKGED